MLYLLICILTLIDHREGRGGVKLNCVRSMANGERKLANTSRSVSKARRNASISYETLGTSVCFSGDDFQNTGTFIVVRSSVFAKSSAQNTHLARDAYHA